MEGYLSVYGQTVSEKTIEKSRFIATSAHVESEEEAREFIASVKRRYKDATHNCYAFISDSCGNLLRFSDDGEPQGTAGMPILEVIKNLALRQTAVVVTRYFGGIKLGAGGLVRAYSGAAAENLSAAKKALYCPCVKLECKTDYASADAASRFFGESECSLENTEYSDVITFNLTVKKENAESFISALTDRLNGRVSVNVIDESVCPFRID